MKITREKHFLHLTRLMPLLILAFLAQSYLYHLWAPSHIATDVSVFVAILIVLAAGGFAFYDQFHHVTLHRHHMVVGLPMANMKEDIFYRDVEHMEIKVTKQAYYNVTLHLWDGRIKKIYYLDDVKELKHVIASK